MNNFVWLVIPAYNESSIIRSVVENAQNYFENIIVVDDGSVDDTERELMYTKCWYLKHPVNLGQGAALKTGIDFALSKGALFIATFDADGQHSPVDVLIMYDLIIKSNNVDIVLGSRFLGTTLGMPYTKKLILKAAVLFMRLMSGVPLTDAHNGLRLFTRATAERLKFYQNGMAHASEIIDLIGRLKLNYLECGVSVKYTEYSISKGQRISNALQIVFNYMIEKFIK